MKKSEAMAIIDKAPKVVATSVSREQRMGLEGFVVGFACTSEEIDDVALLFMLHCGQETIVRQASDCWWHYA